MTKFSSLLMGACALTMLTASAAYADTVVDNSKPTAGWLYGSGNNYDPANTRVLTTTAGDELFLRMHNTFATAPASVGGVYNFVLGAQQVSFDWGYDTVNPFTGTALITLTNLGDNTSFSYNPLYVGNDNTTLAGGIVENSGRDNWYSSLFTFDTMMNSSVKTTLTLTGLDGGTKSVDVIAQFGSGAPGGVPEPATWAMMLVGFGMMGFMLRRDKRATATA